MAAKTKNTQTFTVKALADLAGISVRTLHLYDELGLLKPMARTMAGYRQYGDAELLRLQQILFYRELDFTLQQIADILDDPGFDLVKALQQHKTALTEKRRHMDSLLHTIDKTITSLQNKLKMKPEELYEGLPKEEADAYRHEAAKKYGEENVSRAENNLTSMGQEEFAKLNAERIGITENLLELVEHAPTSNVVQHQIGRHYNLIRRFWGTQDSADKQAAAYKGLGELYVQDGRFTMTDGKPNPAFAAFLSKAMAHYADTELGESK